MAFRNHIVSNRNVSYSCNFAYFKYLMKLYKSLIKPSLRSVFTEPERALFIKCSPIEHIVSKRLSCAILAKILGVAPALNALPTIVINH